MVVAYGVLTNLGGLLLRKTFINTGTRVVAVKAGIPLSSALRYICNDENKIWGN